MTEMTSHSNSKAGNMKSFEFREPLAWPLDLDKVN